MQGPPPLQGDFSPAEKFSGAQPGYVFKKGAKGLGYYRDVPLQVGVSVSAAATTASRAVAAAVPPPAPAGEKSPPKEMPKLTAGFIPPQLLARREEVKATGPSFQHVTAHSQKPKPKKDGMDDAFSAFLQSVEKQ